MRSSEYSGILKKVGKLMQSRGHNIEKLLSVMDGLANGRNLEERFYDHPLLRVHIGMREYHIEPDPIGS